MNDDDKKRKLFINCINKMIEYYDGIVKELIKTLKENKMSHKSKEICSNFIKDVDSLKKRYSEINEDELFYFFFDVLNVNDDTVLQIFKDLAENYNAPNLFDTLPTSPILHLTNQAINAFGAGRPINPNKNTKVEYSANGENAWSITSKNKSNEITLSIDNIQLLKTNNKGLKKCFAFILIQCNNQNYNHEIGFPLQALVDNGMYSSIPNARRGLKDNIEKIMSMTFKGNSKKGRKTVSEQGGKLIYHYEIKNNYVTLSFNEKINIDFMAQYFTLLPKFSFALTNNAFSLLEYIFFRARQETKNIKENGKFNISLRSIRDYMNLPNEKETKDHTKLIKNPIENAITEIEEANNNNSFTITPVYDENSRNISVWLDGYLEIGIKNEFAKLFIGIAENTQKKIEENNKRKQKALTIVEAKKLQNASN